MMRLILPLMKKFAAFLVAALLTLTLSAQDFEGTITWKMTAEIADPALKAKMQAAQAQLASPAMQAKMQQAQAAMQSPQMQEMMRQNPQMKAMIERQLAALKGPAAASDNPLSAMLPESFTFKTKGQRSLVIIKGGPAAGEILTMADKNATYRLNREAQTYQKVTREPAETPASPTYRITRTTETAKILGYTCTRCDVEPSTSTSPVKMTYAVWVTAEIKGLDPKKLRAIRVGQGRGASFIGQLDGVPLKLEVHSPKANFTMEVTAITPGTLPAAEFELPADFTEAGE